MERGIIVFAFVRETKIEISLNLLQLLTECFKDFD
jgi:hypothetical protein